MKRVSEKVLMVSFVLLVSLSFVSAGVGISWSQESALVPEKTKTCLTYKIYNPFPGDVYAKIELSEELHPIIKNQESESRFIPEQTSSTAAIPVTFCFKTPNIYERDCLIGDSLICKQECNEDMKIYEGDVNIMQMDEDEFKAGGSGGSKTSMSVSAPLRVRVQCIASGYNYSIVYVLIALVAGVLLVFNIINQKKKAKRKAKAKKKKANKKKANKK